MLLSFIGKHLTTSDWGAGRVVTNTLRGFVGKTRTERNGPVTTLLTAKLGRYLLTSRYNRQFLPVFWHSPVNIFPQQQQKTSCANTMVASATVVLRRLALPAATKSTRQQLRSASSLCFRSTLAPFSSLRPTSDHGVLAGRGMATMSAGDALARLASDHPHQEIIRYEHKNVKWTLKHVNYYSDALACGLVDAGLQPGDVVLSWLPSHFAEQVSV